MSIAFHKHDYASATSAKGMPNFDDVGDVMWTYRRMVKRSDCPHLMDAQNEKKRRALEKEYGMNSALVRSMIYGEFVAAEESDAVFDPIHHELCLRAMRGEFTPHPGEQRFAGDVSAGGDRMVFGVREGGDVLRLKAEPVASELDIADRWVKWLKALGANPHQFTIDGGGIGKTVGNYMEARLDFWGITRFGYNNAPHEKIAFADRYTELHWILREMLELQCLRLPHCKELLSDMRDRRYVLMNGDKVKCEPKKSHRKRCNGKSPDHLDTLIYLIHDFPIHEVRGKMQQMQAKVRNADDELTPFEREMQQQAGDGPQGAFGGLPAMPSVADLAFSRR